MPRSVKRFSSDFLEEYEELQNRSQNETYQYEDYDATPQENPEPVQEPTEEIAPQDASSSNVWKKLGKVALIILIFVALFFASMHITTFVLNMNHQVDDYSNDAPDYDNNETDEDFGIVIETNENTESVTVLEEDNEVSEKPSSSAPATSETKKPATTTSEEKKEPAEKPADSTAKTETPSSSGTTVKDNTQTPSTSEKPASGNIKPEKPVTAPKPSAPSATPAPSTSLVPSTPSLVPGA